MKIIIIFFASVLLHATSFSQYTFLEFRYSSKDKGIIEPFNFNIKKTHRNFIEEINNDFIKSKLIKTEKTKTGKAFLFRFKIDQRSSYNIGNGYGGDEIFLSPGDTDVIEIKNIAGNPFLKDSIPNYFIFLYNHSGNSYNENQFFDSLAFIAGALNVSSISFKQANHNINMFFEFSTQELHKRLDYLKEYHSRHPLSDFFYRLAVKEINAAYTYNLLSPMINPYVNIDYHSLSSPYKDAINNFKPDDREAFFNTEWYDKALTLFNNIVFTKMDYPNYYSPTQFEGRFNSIEKNTKDQLIKDELLSKLMFEFLKKEIVNYDSLFLKYKTICKNYQYTKFIDSVYSLEKSRLKITKNTAFNTLIENVSGEIKQIDKLFTGKPIVIDCWASWCSPCLEQFKFQKKIDSLFADKISFINLSFDKNKDVWLKKNMELQLVNEKSYILQSGFNSNFSKYFNMASIPQYIFINKDGSISNIHGLRPSNTKKFIDQLNKMIK